MEYETKRGAKQQKQFVLLLQSGYTSREVKDRLQLTEERFSKLYAVAKRAGDLP